MVPQKIVNTNLRPDIVYWLTSQQVVYFIELTLPWETSLEEAHERKKLKFDEWRERQKREDGSKGVELAWMEVTRPHQYPAIHQKCVPPTSRGDRGWLSHFLLSFESLKNGVMNRFPFNV